MKTLLAFLVVIVLGVANLAAAAAPVITVDDNLNAIIDGVNAGLAGDAIVNHPTNAPAINTALKAKLAALTKKASDDAAATVQAAQDAAAAAVTKAQSDAAAAVKAAQDARDAAVQAKTAAETSQKAACDKTAAIVAALKSVTMGTLPPVVAQAIVDDDTKRRAELTAQKATLEAEIAKLAP